jgi:hypothetical protein
MASRPQVPLETATILPNAEDLAEVLSVASYSTKMTVEDGSGTKIGQLLDS